jgi:DeoR/GlpR family transcriptional regulator of sugar metabolism
MPDTDHRENPEARRETILAHLSTRDRAAVIDLSQLLGVSDVTVRKDLDALEGLGLLTRVHGGAVISGRGRIELHFAARAQQQIEEKRRIAQSAAALIRGYQRIFLDASSTAVEVARLIKDHKNLLVVTNGLFTALELNFSPGVTTIVVGGRMRRRSSSLVGGTSLNALERLRLQVGVFGAAGVTGADGLLEADLDEANLKQQVVAACEIVVGIVDSRKFGVSALSAFALPHELDRVITDAAAPAAIVAALRAQDVLVDLV